jgi:hypothetical protein
MTRRQRSRESFRRRPASVEPRACVLLVCEGAKTEPLYFRSLRRKLRLKPVEIEIVGQGAAPITVVQRAVEMRDARRHEVRRGRKDFEYDHVCCVIDVEQPHENPSLLPALNQARDNKISVALSNPCFEYWFILHFADYGKPLIDQDGVVRELKRHIPEYDKAQDVFDLVWACVDQAVRRAKAVKKSHEAAGTARHHRDPSTEVDEVVELLRHTATRPK